MPVPGKAQSSTRPGAVVQVRATRVDDWAALKAIRLAALAEAPNAFGVTLAQALENTDQQWRDHAAGAGPARFFLAHAGDVAAEESAEHDADAAASAGQDASQPAAGADAAQPRLSVARPGIATPLHSPSGAIGMVAAVRLPDGCLNLIAMWVDPRWRGRRSANAAGGRDGGAVQPAAGARGTAMHAGAGSVADELIVAVKTYAAAAAATAVLLEVAPDNVRAVALYQRHGFCFQSHVEQLASHPHIQIQRMGWQVAPVVRPQLSDN